MTTCDGDACTRPAQVKAPPGDGEMRPGTAPSDAKLRLLLAQGNSVAVDAGTLWDDGKPVVICVVRRFGCPFCRAGIAAIQARKASFSALGAKVVVVGGQATGADKFVAALKWDGPVYVDDAQALHRVFTGDLRNYQTWWLLKPKVAWAASGLMKKFGGETDDLNAKSYALGGEFVVRSGQVVYARPEGTDFSHAKVDTLLKFCSPGVPL